MKRVVFWIGSRRKFTDEARRCSIELREVMPGTDHILFTPDKTRSEGFDRIALLPQRKGKYWYLDSVRYFNMAFDLLDEYDECLYFDSDINFMSPFPELWRMLERFDIVAPVGSRRVTGATFQELPPCFPEYEIGVILFRRNAIVKEMFVEWERLHWAHPDIYGNNDQRSFREAVWNTPELKIERIPTEYALRWPFGVYMSLEVKILHGRPMGEAYPDSPTVDEVRAIVNTHLDMRIWSPRDRDWRDGVIPEPDYYDRVYGKQRERSR
jgi:hypothetical protein